MLCDICKKKEATIHFTEILDQKVAKFNFCENCIKTKNIKFPFGKPHFSLADLLASLSDLSSDTARQKVEIRCPTCGASYDDFKQNGRLGCSRCYETFRQELSSLLKRIHGANQHLGKISFKVDKIIETKIEMKKLRNQLQEAISKEEYEKAALLRDQIKQLENRKNNSGK